MALGGVDWRMAQPMQAGAPDWRQIMQAAVFGGAGMPASGSNAPINPATLPGMIDQIAGDKKGGGTKKPTAPTTPKPPTTTTMQPTPPTPIKNRGGVVSAWKFPDGTMYDMYGNQWDASGNMLGPPGA